MFRPTSKELDPQWIKLVHAEQGTQLALEDTYKKIRRNLQHKLDGVTGEPFWPISRSDVRIYERTFVPVLNQSFQEFLQGRKDPAVLDIMSFGWFVVSLLEQKLIRVGLSINTNPDSQKMIPHQYAATAQNLIADVFLPETTVQIDEWMSKNQVQKFDLIVNHGCGGVNYLPNDICAQYHLLNEYWKKLSVGGMLLTQVKYELPILEGLANFLNQSGVEASCAVGKTPLLITSDRSLDDFDKRDEYNRKFFHSRVLSLVKTAHSPAQLPIPKI